MGAWGVSITGNDTAEDLKLEYTCAFYKYDVPTALEKLDKYARKELDEDEWCDYVYSLVDFMWRKGILTNEVRDRAVNMIDSGTGLEVYADAGAKVLRDRQKVLEKFREKLFSSLPSKKKIKPDFYLEDIFTNGDIIAIQLHTKGKPYSARYNDRDISEEEFHSYDGKYVLIQKITTHISCRSDLVPECADHWAVFRLFDGIYDEVPTSVNINELKPVCFNEHQFITSLFVCESSIYYFKKRNYVIVGSDTEPLKNFSRMRTYDHHIFLGDKGMLYNADSGFISAMGKESVISEYSGELKDLIVLAQNALPQRLYYDWSKTREENEAPYKLEKEKILCDIQAVLDSGGRIYTISTGSRTNGMISVCDKRIDNLYVVTVSNGMGYATSLINHAVTIIGNGAYADIPKDSTELLGLFKKLGFEEIESDNREKTRVIHNS